MAALSSLFLGHFCSWLLVADGGLRGWARVADFALSGVIATCQLTIYHLLANVLRFLVTDFCMWSLCILVIVIGKLT